MASARSCRTGVRVNALATLPALPLHEAGKYVAGAYIVVFALVLVYVAIMATRMSRIERELGELLGSERGRDGRTGADAEALP
jgi:CcmD family protein